MNPLAGGIQCCITVVCIIVHTNIIFYLRDKLLSTLSPELLLKYIATFILYHSQLNDK